MESGFKLAISFNLKYSRLIPKIIKIIIKIWNKINEKNKICGKEAKKCTSQMANIFNDDLSYKFGV
jgi:hypothetical protein